MLGRCQGFNRRAILLAWCVCVVLIEYREAARPETALVPLCKCMRPKLVREHILLGLQAEYQAAIVYLPSSGGVYMDI